MNADVQVLAEQALRHVLQTQAELLKRADRSELFPLIEGLNQIAQSTQELISEGLHRVKTFESILKNIRALESQSDVISKELWCMVVISISPIYENLERALKPPKDKYGASVGVRSHYENMRLRLLQQTLGARMLRGPSDLGIEMELIWQQFLQKHLGDTVRVLKGGVISDYEGNYSEHQIDLIVVPANANVVAPGDSEDGKVHVYYDQVISAIMVTSTLDREKLERDWMNLANIPSYVQKEKDHPRLAKQPWPLRFIVGSQSEPLERLEEKWCKLVEEKAGPPPELVVTLDSGFLYSGATAWPKPRASQTFTEANQVEGEQDSFRGLGLAWLLLQHKARLAIMQNQPIASFERYARSLQIASLKHATPATWSPKFSASFRMGKIAGVLGWGSYHPNVHNTLFLNSLMKEGEGDLHHGNVKPQPGPDWTKGFETVRLFRYPAVCMGGNFMALEEWFNSKSKDLHKTKIALFNFTTGEEILDHDLTSITEVDKFASP